MKKQRMYRECCWLAVRGGRLGILTESIWPKPAIPYGGKYRIHRFSAVQLHQQPELTLSACSRSISRWNSIRISAAVRHGIWTFPMAAFMCCRHM